VEGIDAAHKLTILSAVAFGIPLDFSKTYTEGITKITPADVEYANELGYTIKHLGITRKTENGIEQRVHPTLIPKSRLIANVNGVMNAVLVHGDAVGPTLYYGAGAGDEPTASAVVADTPILGMDDIQTAYYLRVCAVDQPGVLASITAIMGACNISIEAFIQREPAPGVHDVDIILLTQRVREGNMNIAIEKIEALDVTCSPVPRIRVETLK
jgi:homoserine dehydrogenase